MRSYWDSDTYFTQGYTVQLAQNAQYVCPCLNEKHFPFIFSFFWSTISDGMSRRQGILSEWQMSEATSCLYLLTLSVTPLVSWLGCTRSPSYFHSFEVQFLMACQGDKGSCQNDRCLKQLAAYAYLHCQ